jgi:hypothetical protein
MIHSGNIEGGHELSKEDLLKLGNDKVCCFFTLHYVHNSFHFCTVP